MLRNFKALSFFSFVALAVPVLVQAQNSKRELGLSVYNSGIALVSDNRSFALKKGENSLLFNDVAEKMLPETAFLQGDGIYVSEQNYNYNLLTPVNIVNASIGKTVKTALFDEASGKTIFNKAKIIDSRYGRPILEFDYGIEIDFPGRLVFDELPEGLVSSPSLAATVQVKNAGEYPVSLTYLAKGLSWKTDYIAEIIGDSKLNLTGWITLNNESGADFKNANLQFIAGEVQQVGAETVVPRAMMLTAASQNSDAALKRASSFLNQIPQKTGDYYLYELPFKTDILNNQSKQMALVKKENVNYEKEFKFVSPLYLWNGVTGGNFEKSAPDIMIKFNNNQNSGLGLVLPQGTIRFYDKTKSGKVAFIGSGPFEKLAIGEKNEIKIGKSFDLTVAGKILNVQKIAKDTIEAQIDVEFNNAASQNESVSFVQNFDALWEIVDTNIPVLNKTAQKAEWNVSVPSHGKTILSYRVKLSRVNN